jgi:hypothetical protein
MAIRHDCIPDDVFIKAWEDCNFSPATVAKALGVSERNVYARRNALEGRGIALPTVRASNSPIEQSTYKKVINLAISDGVVVVGSDAHIWPGPDTTALKALLAVTADLGKSVRLLIANGDWMDGASTNRHDPFGWQQRPTVREEIAGVTDALHRWRMAAKPARTGVRSIYTVGNHELNFERRLATQVHQYEGLPGLRLADHFPEWELTWSCWMNRTSQHPVMVKHRQANGVHAAYNNTLKSGVSMVTGHTHVLEVKPWGDYRGRRWGVQTGTLAMPTGPQFEYAENGYTPACAGFAVLTFKDGRLLPPEICEVIEGRAMWRGQVVIDDHADYLAEQEVTP